MDYIPRSLLMTTAVAGFAAGDYALYFANLGTGAIDYDTPISVEIPLLGETSIVAPYNAPTASADWDFGVETFDTEGNDSESPQTFASFIDCEPASPDAMTITSYDDATEVLVLTL